MLSTTPSGLQVWNRQHRRQNSTPTAFETMKIATNLPSMHQHQQQRSRISHRRGLSLDIRRQQQMQSPTTPLRQEIQTVSNDTNIGLTTPQHVPRETQQQRIARPGPQHAYANLASDENYLLSPHGTPQMQNFEVQCFDGLPSQQDINLSFEMYNGPMNAIVKNQESFSSNMTASSDFDLLPSSALSTPSFVNFQEGPTGGPGWISEGETASTRRNSRRISNGIMDRVAKFENNVGAEVPQRPLTPPRQNATDYFPLTPMDTPHDRTIKHSRQPERFAEGYDESMEETVKPTRNRRPQTTFDEMRQAAEAQAAGPTTHRPNTMPLPGAFNPPSDPTPDFMTMNPTSNHGLRIETTFHGLPGPSHPMSAASDISQRPSPATPHMSEFSSAFDYRPDLTPHDAGSDVLSAATSPSTETLSHRASPHHRRNESVASITSAASIANIDIEKTKTETGITLDDIHKYIDGPDPRDNKWICTFEDCNKRFGRKENIKSHVQTHLNDRQYKCPTCDKCFVRQHDLKRHAKIHTGIKPYPCECGNSFARHDALTRHRQRGMCIGAFDGVVRKVVKRGRPRKQRPDMEERKDKAARTRKKIKSTSSASSQSGYSDSSAVNSPENEDNTDPDFDLGIDMIDVSMGGTTMMNPGGLQGACSSSSSSAPMPSLATDASMSTTHSPSAASVHSYVSQLSQMSLHPEQQAADALQSQPVSPAKSVASQINELPELSQSSSPPSCNRYFDVEPGSGASAEAMMGSNAAETVNLPSFDGLGGSGGDDIMVQFTNSDSSMLMLSSDGKFDDSFDDMFASHDDMFFGSA
ncbi:hypothetical protein F4779DRAFT_549840 [Xylariaceae sp. FL0662B]|nr:hypothetical protein F4779DRAFT_549840 [Xylariaceae sp. FL0662B]